MGRGRRHRRQRRDGNSELLADTWRDRISELLADTRRDRISELPADILDKILVLLTTVEAARLAVLSTHWRNVWLNLTELDFGHDFFCHIRKKYDHDEKENIDICTSMSFYVINKVLMQHNGVIRKFAFNFPFSTAKEFSYRSFGFDQWLPFVTQNGVEEIDISVSDEGEYKLPKCIFSCLTLRSLRLNGISVEPLNAHCTLPNLTSLCFESINFDGGDLLPNVPMLDSLSFVLCETESEINITAQKLSSLAITSIFVRQLSVNLGLESVRTLELDCTSLEDFVDRLTGSGLQQQPPTLNVEHLMLSNNYGDVDDDISEDISDAFIHLLRICPKLCQLDIDLEFSPVACNCFFDPERRHFKEFHAVTQRHKLLQTLNLNSFRGAYTETLFIMVLLDSFLALEKVVITPARSMAVCYEDAEYEYFDFETHKLELLDFHCASTKAKIIFSSKNP
ncbi:PREDICTED: F-box/FBD/LRR-repeat protein At1g13570-like [Ipomoea nil]|uniref:F-box/FBD/LRR-repeat protein At1g13570-like n=1 Tax=Ipomoea nil TaxID=35883 RepID=UPI000900BD43|nr:PREDICTED: F-box/FBD/LRR-repeat protein At1g13570-like [Ipomoea nil]